MVSESGDIIAVIETTTKPISLLNNLILNELLQLRLLQIYITNDLSYKYHNYLNIYENNELESIFIESVNPKKSNIIVGVIY